MFKRTPLFIPIYTYLLIFIHIFYGFRNEITTYISNITKERRKKIINLFSNVVYLLCSAFIHSFIDSHSFSLYLAVFVVDFLLKLNWFWIRIYLNLLIIFYHDYVEHGGANLMSFFLTISFCHCFLFCFFALPGYHKINNNSILLVAVI